MSRRRTRCGRQLLVVVGLILATLAIGTWGYLELDALPDLNFGQSLYHAFKLYVFDIGPAGGGGSKNVGPNWQILVAAALAALLVTRALLAIVGGRVRRAMIRRFLSGHVIVCGGGVHGSRLARKLSKKHDVVLVDPDRNSAGMQARLGHHEWRLVGDASQKETLLAAGVLKANWVVAIAGNAFVNSQIVTAIQSLRGFRDGLHVLVQVEDPKLARFLEEEPASMDGTVASRPRDADGTESSTPVAVVTPFSPNAIAAEVLLAERKDLFKAPDGVTPHLILAGDHLLLDSILRAALQRWRVRMLRDFEDGRSGKPPFRVSVYGADAADRVDAFVRKWEPEPQVFQLFAGTVEEDRWLHERHRARHAIVACNQELESVRLTLEISRALGGDVEMTRVATQPKSVLDKRLKHRTAASPDLATTKIRDIAVLGSNSEKMSADARTRLIHALEKRNLNERQARERTAALLSRKELSVHSDSTWRVLPAERPLLRALVHPVPVSALVEARLAVDLGTPENLRTAAERLSDEGDMFAAFAAWCEYLRHVARESPDEMRTGLALRTADEAAEGLLRLRRTMMLASRAARNGDPGLASGTAHARAVIFTGDPAPPPATSRALKKLLEHALADYPGIVYSRAAPDGSPGVVGEVARGLHLKDVREHPSHDGIGVEECLRTWRELSNDGIDVEDVRVVAYPDGDETVAEILLARALGARVVWVDPAGEAEAAPVDILPLGAADVLELPADAMTLRGLLRWSRAPEEIREQLARSLHADYRRRQRGVKRQGDPALEPWDRLPVTLQDSNRHQADDIENKLATVGKRLERVEDGGERLDLSDKEVEQLAEMEHGRYNVERLSSGWRLGERHISRLASPHLSPWDELKDDIKDYDRQAVLDIDSALEAVGWGIVVGA